MSTKTRIARLEKSAQSTKRNLVIVFGRPNGTYWVQGRNMSAQQFERWQEEIGYHRVMIVRFSPQ